MTDQELEMLKQQYAYQAWLTHQGSSNPADMFSGKTSAAKHAAYTRMLSDLGYKPSDLTGGDYAPAKDQLPFVPPEQVDVPMLVTQSYGNTAGYKDMFDLIRNGADPRSAANQVYDQSKAAADAYNTAPFDMNDLSKLTPAQKKQVADMSFYLSVRSLDPNSPDIGSSSAPSGLNIARARESDVSGLTSLGDKFFSEQSQSSKGQQSYAKQLATAQAAYDKANNPAKNTIMDQPSVLDSFAAKVAQGTGVSAGSIANNITPQTLLEQYAMDKNARQTADSGMFVPGLHTGRRSPVAVTPVTSDFYANVKDPAYKQALTDQMNTMLANQIARAKATPVRSQQNYDFMSKATQAGYNPFVQ